MEIVSVKATRGPNFWSVQQHKLIVAVLNTAKVEQDSVEEEINWRERLKSVFPAEVLLDAPGIRQGITSGYDSHNAAYAVLYSAVQLQNKAGIMTGFALTKPIDSGKTYVVFSYSTEEAGRYALRAAVRIVEKLLNGENYQDLEEDIEEIKYLELRYSHGPSTNSIVQEAARRGIPHFELPSGLIQFGYGANQKRISATITSNTGAISVDIAGDKDSTKKLLDFFHIPVPKGTIIYDRHDLPDAIESVGFPLVIKPLDSNQGKGATINVSDYHCALGGLLAAKKYCSAVIVEKYISGFDHRLLVINKKFVAASKRTPAAVVGDGKSSIRQLVNEVNKDPRRGEGHKNVLTKIKIDAMSRRILKDKELTLDSILRKGEVLYLKDTANLSTGGTAVDVTDKVHPDTIFMAERIARIVGLDICGIDLMTPDISKPVSETGGAVLEVNAAPGFRMHTHPTEGTPRNVAAPVVDMLFPEGNSYSVPIVAITGTNGKTTTSRLIAHIAKTAGKNVGYTNTDGIYVNGHLIDKGDSSGPGSAELILKDPSVEFAVLECARGGLLRSGLAFAKCDVGVVTNVTADHLGIGGINTLEDLAVVKSLVAETVSENGYAVLNAGDERVYAMKNRVRSKVALFSRDENNKRIREHVEARGLAAVESNGIIKILEGEKETELGRSFDIPITMGGRAPFMTENVLAASLAAYASGFPEEVIREALLSFKPSASQTPGRMNLYKFRNFELLIDFAHNPAGLEAIRTFIENVNAPVKIGIVGAVGDRRDEDIKDVGRVAATMFDTIIIRQDKDLRGRTEEEMVNLVKQGIREVGMDGKEILSFRYEADALKYIIHNAPKGAFITMLSDKVQEVIKMVEEYKAEEGLVDA